MLLEGQINARDLGGLKTADGRQVKPNKLIRSGHLNRITAKDKQTLASIGLEKIIDLRTPEEQGQKPDIVPEGAEYIFCPVVEQMLPGITREAIEDVATMFRRNAAEALAIGANGKEHMRRLYPVLAEDLVSQQRYARLLDEVMTADGAVMFHCSMGKDRAGVASALVLYLLGVPMDTIVEDYMFTGIRCAKMIEDMSDECREFTDDPVLLDSIYWLNTVDESYILSFFSAAEEISGSIDAYIEDKLDFNADKKTRLREKYLI